MRYARSPFRDFDRYLRTVVGSDKDDIQLSLKQQKSNFVSYEISPGIHSIKFISEVLHTMGDHEGTLQIKFVNVSVKTKLF